MNKKGVSPVVATVLLIVIVVILALIIFLWARGFIKESIIKKGENAEFACGKIKFEATYISDTQELQITNVGNIPVYRVIVKIQEGGTITKRDYNESIANGQSIVISEISNGERIIITPVILGQVKKNNSKVAFICKTEIVPDRE